MCGREFNSLTNLSPVSKIPRRGEEEYCGPIFWVGCVVQVLKL